jgi:drug/metabolite transporter (DMT)-like permease
MDPVAIVFGVASAASWGSSDFAGGLVSRRLGSLTTATAGQVIGFVAIVGVALLSAESAVGWDEALWSIAAGLGGAVGLVSLYRALASGEMSLVAPLTGALGAGLPVVASFALGESVTAPQAAGIGCALGAIVVVSLGSRSGGAIWRTLPLVALAGLGFATFYVSIDRAVAVSGHLWLPLLIARGCSLGVFLAASAGRAVAIRGSAPRPGDVLADWPLLVAVGLGDLGGNVFFVLANALSPLSIAVVLSSLYPVATALLAWLLLRERLAGHQLGGAALAVAGIVLIAA